MSMHAHDFLAIAQPFLANYVIIQYVTSEDPLSQGAIVIDQLGHTMLLDRTYALWYVLRKLFRNVLSTLPRHARSIKFIQHIYTCDN